MIHNTHQVILQIIYDSWNSFREVGSVRPMFDFEFYNDSGDTNVMCCR